MKKSNLFIVAVFSALIISSCSQEQTEELNSVPLNGTINQCEENGFMYTLAKWKENGESGSPVSICDDIEASGCGNTLKIEDNFIGEHNVVLEETGLEGSITISRDIDGNLKWETHGDVKICRVMVKGGPGANVYGYDCEDTCATGLNTPVNAKNGKNYGISHITFCYRSRSKYCPS